ncbi:MAG TPA: hypothetical protein DGL25_02545 [Dehalococcoidia bacterium]|nr:hypothetical protein [Dehalococcoidia bacterium]
MKNVISFDREVRTPHSESYTMLDNGEIVGRVDLHIQGPNIHATLCTTPDASDDRIRDLIDAVDEQIAMTADPFREDFIVTVWKGVPAGVYGDAEASEDKINLGEISENS